MPANTRNKWEIWLAAILSRVSRAYFDAMSGTLTPHCPPTRQVIMNLARALYRVARYRYLCAMGHTRVANALYRSCYRGF